MEPLELNGNIYNNWQDFFHKILEPEFTLFNTKCMNDMTIEEYKYREIIKKTNIIIAYYKNSDKLLYYRIINPISIGYTEYQNVDIQFFEEGQYERPPLHGEPGLVFRLINLKEIHNELLRGLNGKEIQLIDNNKVIKSTVTLADHGLSYNYRFDRKNIIGRFLFYILGKERKLENNIIDLKDIFPGLSHK